MKIQKLTEETFYLIAAVICSLLIIPVLYYTSGNFVSKVYDCSIAEISPDYPIKVKEECRKLRTEKIK